MCAWNGARTLTPLPASGASASASASGASDIASGASDSASGAGGGERTTSYSFSPLRFHTTFSPWPELCGNPKL